MQHLMHKSFIMVHVSVNETFVHNVETSGLVSSGLTGITLQ